MRSRDRNHCEKQAQRFVSRERSWESRRNRNRNLVITVILLSFLVFIIAPFFTSCTPAGVALFNTWDYALQKTDDATNYNTKKRVEDTCRSMVASYESDKLIYEQYKESADEEKQSWAEQAKMRANKTAVTYNEYVLKNSYVWEDNIPEDIDTQLSIIQ